MADDKEMIEYLGQMIPRRQYMGIVTKKDACRMCGGHRFMHYVDDGYFDAYECEECRTRI